MPKRKAQIAKNLKGETVLRTFGTTKRSRNNPIRLSDGKVHPVITVRMEPRQSGTT
jgi:hypothetical protein